MSIKDKIKVELGKVYGDFNSYLEIKYEDRIIEILSDNDNDLKYEWLTYNQVIIELKSNLKNMVKVKELQYRLTDGENPKKACVDIIESVGKSTYELNRLYNKLINLKN